MTDLGVRFLGDPVVFLEEAAHYLRARPVTATVVATVAERWRRSGHAPGSPYDWFAVVEADGEVVGAAMRTAPFDPHPIYVLDQPEDAARALARALVERGEPVAAVSGLRPAVDVLAAEAARLGGGDARVDLHMRLFELGSLRPPAEVATGRLRRAEYDDLDLAVEWFRRFHRDADEQAGRAAGHSTEGEGEEVVDDVRARIAIGSIWLWEDDGGPRHLTAANPPALGVVRIGPVFTPAEHRGQGYAASAVSEIAAGQRAAGHRVVLFTDQANPVSNRLYLGLGFEAVVDTASLVVQREVAAPR